MDELSAAWPRGEGIVAVGVNAEAQGHLADLRVCATDHLDAYMNPAGDYAFHTYDRCGDTNRLAPLDFFAPELLSVEIRREWVRELFKPTGPWSELRGAMQAVLDNGECQTADFIDVKLASIRQV